MDIFPYFLEDTRLNIVDEVCFEQLARLSHLLKSPKILFSCQSISKKC